MEKGNGMKLVLMSSINNVFEHKNEEEKKMKEMRRVLIFVGFLFVVFLIGCGQGEDAKSAVVSSNGMEQAKTGRIILDFTTPQAKGLSSGDNYKLQSFLRDSISAIDVRLYQVDEDGVQSVDAKYCFYISNTDQEEIVDIEIGDYHLSARAKGDKNSTLFLDETNIISVIADETTRVKINFEQYHALSIPVKITNPEGVYTEGERYSTYFIGEGFSLSSGSLLYENGELTFWIWAYMPYNETILSVSIMDDDGYYNQMFFDFDIMDIIDSNGEAIELKPSTQVSQLEININFDFENSIWGDGITQCLDEFGDLYLDVDLDEGRAYEIFFESVSDSYNMRNIESDILYYGNRVTMWGKFYDNGLKKYFETSHEGVFTFLLRNRKTGEGCFNIRIMETDVKTSINDL